MGAGPHLARVLRTLLRSTSASLGATSRVRDRSSATAAGLKTRQSFEQFLWENRKPWYLGPVVGKEFPALRGGLTARARDKKIFIWTKARGRRPPWREGAADSGRAVKRP